MPMEVFCTNSLVIVNPYTSGVRPSMRNPVQALIELGRSVSRAIIERCAVKRNDDTYATHC